MANKALIGPAEAAEILKINPMTVRRMSDKGLLPFIVTPGGHRRYQREDVLAYCRQHGIDVEEDTERRVLLVDDDSQILDLLTLYIRSADKSIRVLQAQDGFEAGLQVVEFKPQLIITDLMMPKVDGIEVCRQINQRAETRSITVVGMTGSDDISRINQFLSAGGHSCIVKPIKKQDFIQLVNTLV